MLGILSIFCVMYTIRENNDLRADVESLQEINNGLRRELDQKYDFTLTACLGKFSDDIMLIRYCK